MSFYVRVRPSGRWFLYEEKYENGERKQLKVELLSYQAIGIHQDLTPSQARERVKEINRENSKLAKTISAAARKADALNRFDDIFFKEKLVAQFIERLQKRAEDNPAHYAKLVSHFHYVQKMILKLKHLPKQYSDESDSIYSFMIGECISVDYAKKIVQMLNAWGRFVAKTNNSFFEDVAKPNKTQRKNLAKAQRKVLGVRRESARLERSMLSKLKSKLPIEEYNWVLLSFWFGLRPSEVDSLVQNSSNSKHSAAEIETNQSGIKVLKVFQSKIEDENVDKAYKFIPILFSEQIEALKLLPNIRRPKPQSLKAVVPKLDTYGGRKGFADLMQSLGQQIEHVSIWLGHTDIKMTLATYKQRSNVPFTQVKKRAS